ncbi:hypothetical protein [Actinomadura montaniterrae]|uniref:Uncharacterized protein n=1 Tax=Actinomadura montaniterrae TaxID=1803903 RepID=A0A6L3W1R0_9ACTN|nr:hypothetical protein [Actinomadura montaniterrae]KAB2388439.1 hypothetical protein F9B16_03955 [Actinomadura montaniterrae]
MNRWLLPAEMQARDLAGRWPALALLFALPATWYLAELASGRPWAIGAGALAMGWTSGAAALFAVLGARRADPRLVQAGYRPVDLAIGRLAVLLGVALAVAAAFGVLIVACSRPDRLRDLFLGLVLGGLVSVMLGWAIAVLVPHELEATLLLIGFAGIAPTAPGSLGDYLPFYALLRFTDVTRPSPAALPLVLHALAYAIGLAAVALLVWHRRVRLVSERRSRRGPAGGGRGRPGRAGRA